MADPFPLYVPSEARRLFQSESLLRRFAQMARWDDSASLLELHGSIGGLALARALACHLTVIEPDSRQAESLKERCKAIGVTDKVAVQTGSITSIKFAERAFDGIFSFGRVIGVPAEIAKHWRPSLAVNGRLGLTAIVRVGRQINEAVIDAWAERLGEAPINPRETLMSVESEGFEPEHIETLGDVELEEFYKEVENALGRSDRSGPEVEALKDELALFKKYGSKAGVSIAFLIVRRKEPGEKPPASRDGG